MAKGPATRSASVSRRPCDPSQRGRRRLSSLPRSRASKGKRAQNRREVITSETPQRPPANIENHVLDFSALKWSALLVSLCLLLAARFPDPLTKPYALIFEEGSVYFQDAYNLPFWQAIFTPYAGYLNILTRLMAEACVWLPYQDIPFVYSLLSLFSAAAVSSFFYLPAFRHVVTRDWQRFAICLGLSAASCAYPLLRLETVHFYLAVFLVLVAIMKLPASLPGKAAVVLAACLSVWSAPSAIVLGPCFLYR